MFEYVTEIEVFGGECRNEIQGVQGILEIVDEYTETIGEELAEWHRIPPSELGLLLRTDEIALEICKVEHEGR